MVREEGEDDFPSDCFCLTVKQNFLGGPLCFEIALVSKIFLDKGVTTFFCQTVLVSQCGKTSWGNLSVFQEISGLENF